MTAISYRLMRAADLGSVPIGHMGTEGEVMDRIAAMGSAAVLAFDGDRHVGQLQFRAYQPGVRSPDSLWDPLYWMDFAGHHLGVPDRSLAVFCYHVGQLDESDDRDPAYLGRGIGLRLLDELVAWAAASGFGGIVAKATPSSRPIMGFTGGQPPSAYEERGFITGSSWVDEDLAAVVGERELAPAGELPAAATLAACVLTFGDGGNGAASTLERP
ncbi:MAG: GNAT family N-acetyltransferase [Actinomycetota bacterium]|nr:GNAT family N-acetyltransferase [Actinomycetota bacterium]